MYEAQKLCCVNLFVFWLIQSLHVILFGYFERTPTDQNFVKQEIKSRLNSGNACCHVEQNILSSSLLFKNRKIIAYKTIILSGFFVGVKFGRSC